MASIFDDPKFSTCPKTVAELLDCWSTIPAAERVRAWMEAQDVLLADWIIQQGGDPADPRIAKAIGRREMARAVLWILDGNKPEDFQD